MLISVLGGKTYFWLSYNFYNFKNFPDVSISEKIQNFDDFSGFVAQNLRDLSIFRLKCNEQHSSIPKSQINVLAKFS